LNSNLYNLSPNIARKVGKWESSQTKEQWNNKNKL
jgi:hypothetical protein